LTPVGTANQLAAWQGLARFCLGAEPDGPGGLRAHFEPEALSVLADVVETERECCPFLSIAVASEDDRMVLSIAIEHADAQPIVTALLAAITDSCRPTAAHGSPVEPGRPSDGEQA
jgi:hypothetical protein